MWNIEESNISNQNEEFSYLIKGAFITFKLKNSSHKTTFTSQILILDNDNFIRLKYHHKTRLNNQVVLMEFFWCS